MATNPGKYAAAGSALEALEGVDVHYNVPLAKRVSMKVGGPAEIKASFIQRERLETFHNQISRAIANAQS